MDYTQLAKDIIGKNQYMTIGSTNPDGSAWVSPVVYVVDQNYNFYWISLPNSNHSQNIGKNKKITLAIFDSHQNFGEGVGLQIEAVAIKLSFKDSLSLQSGCILKENGRMANYRQMVFSSN